MRKTLKPSAGVRGTYTGTFVRTGTKRSYGHPKPTLLFAEIKDAGGQVVTDHHWFNLTQGFAALDLKAGDVVRFDARVKPYTKGYRGHRVDVYKPLETDYKLSHPTRLEKTSP